MDDSESVSEYFARVNIILMKLESMESLKAYRSLRPSSLGPW